MKITYHRCGDYLYPNLYIDPMPSLGKYGMLRMSYLRKHRPNWFQSMLLTGELNEHLAAIDRDANQRMKTLMVQLEKAHPAPDREKDSLAWAAHMNMLTHMAEEVVLSELVYC